MIEDTDKNSTGITTIQTALEAGDDYMNYEEESNDNVTSDDGIIEAEANYAIEDTDINSTRNTLFQPPEEAGADYMNDDEEESAEKNSLNSTAMHTLEADDEYLNDGEEESYNNKTEKSDLNITAHHSLEAGDDYKNDDEEDLAKNTTEKNNLTTRMHTREAGVDYMNEVEVEEEESANDSIIEADVDYNVEDIENNDSKTHLPALEAGADYVNKVEDEFNENSSVPEHEEIQNYTTGKTAPQHDAGHVAKFLDNEKNNSMEKRNTSELLEQDQSNTSAIKSIKNITINDKAEHNTTLPIKEQNDKKKINNDVDLTNTTLHSDRETMNEVGQENYINVNEEEQNKNTEVGQENYMNGNEEEQNKNTNHVKIDTNTKLHENSSTVEENNASYSVHVEIASKSNSEQGKDYSNDNIDDLGTPDFADENNDTLEYVVPAEFENIENTTTNMFEGVTNRPSIGKNTTENNNKSDIKIKNYFEIIPKSLKNMTEKIAKAKEVNPAKKETDKKESNAKIKEKVEHIKPFLMENQAKMKKQTTPQDKMKTNRTIKRQVELLPQGSPEPLLQGDAVMFRKEDENYLEINEDKAEHLLLSKNSM